MITMKTSKPGDDMTFTKESACDWCGNFGVLVRFSQPIDERAEWICPDCEQRFEKSWDDAFDSAGNPHPE